MPEPYDAQDVIAVCTQMQDQPALREWQRANIDRHNFLYRRTAIDIPGLSYLLEDRRPDLRMHANRFNNRLESAEMRVEVYARSSAPAHIKAAQRVENFYYALFEDLRRTRSGRIFGAHRRAIDQTSCYGAGIFHLDFRDNVRSLVFGGRQVTDETVEEEVGREQFVGNPFLLRCPSIFATGWLPDLSIFYEVGVRTGTPSPDQATNGSRPTSDTLYEYQSDWQDAGRIYRLETPKYIYEVTCEHKGQNPELLDRRENAAGRPSYVIIPGNLTSEGTPYESYQPLIAELYPIVQKLGMLGTLMNSGALQTGRNTYQLVPDGKAGASDIIAWMDMPSQERPVLKFNLTDDQVIRPPAGFHYEPMLVPDQRQVIAAYQEARKEEFEAGFPATLAPDAPIDAKSGYDRARQMEAAANSLEPPLRNLAAGWYEVFTLVAEWIKGLDIPVSVITQRRAEGEGANVRRMITVKPADFRDLDLSVRFESVPATVKFAMRQSNQAMLQASLMSRQTFMRTEYDDPIVEEERIKQEAGEVAIDQMALEDARSVIQSLREQFIEEAAAAAGIALPQQPAPAGQQAEGGPAPGEQFRRERPPEGSAMPGVGAPLFPPEQRGAGDTEVPSMGLEAAGVAP